MNGSAPVAAAGLGVHPHHVPSRRRSAAVSLCTRIADESVFFCLVDYQFNATCRRTFWITLDQSALVQTDIGGTNSRLALYDHRNVRLESVMLTSGGQLDALHCNVTNFLSSKIHAKIHIERVFCMRIIH